MNIDTETGDDKLKDGEQWACASRGGFFVWPTPYDGNIAWRYLLSFNECTAQGLERMRVSPHSVRGYWCQRGPDWPSREDPRLQRGPHREGPPRP